MRVCSVSECDRPVRRRGWCHIHYMRWYRHGDPLAEVVAQKPRGMSESEAFAWYMPGNPPPPDQCWDWTGGVLASYGYGRFYLDGKRQVRAHVASYRIHHGPTNGLSVLHSCDRPICVQPAHLRLGTQAENMAEMVERDRHPRGERNGHAKLTEAEVRMIRESNLTQRVLADMLGVHQSTISKTRSGHRWKHQD